MTMLPIKSATASEEPQTVNVVVLAFSSDPVVRWFYPDANQFLTHFPEFVGAFAGGAFKHGSAYYVDTFPGAALWLPSEGHVDGDAVIDLLQRTVHQREQEDL